MEKKVILYGAGNVGKASYQFLKHLGARSSIYAFCDRNAEIIKQIDSVPVMTFDEAKKVEGAVFLITVWPQEPFFYEIKELLETSNVTYYEDLFGDFCFAMGWDRVKIYREYCAFMHSGTRGTYYDYAEGDFFVNKFWGEASPFPEFFERLNLERVIELACGHGRHVPKYIERAGHVTLVDILKENIQFCQERFSQYDKVSYYKNNGFDFSELSDESYTALFTYDAMVHFELIDIYNYLKETYRVLEHGGRALFHHSNYHDDYKASFESSSHGRSFMSKDVFAYLAFRAGLEVEEQKIITWGNCEKLDCITLVYKK